MILVFIITFCVIVALGFGGAAAWSDYTKLTIPNIYAALIGASFIPAFLAVTFLAPEISFFASWKSHLIAFVVVFSITYILFHFNLIGGGDAKLISVFSLWIGLAGLIPFLFYMALMGGILALTTLALHKYKPVKKPKKKSWVALAQRGKKEVPYGIAIFVGAFLAFWYNGYTQPNELLDIAKISIANMES